MEHREKPVVLLVDNDMAYRDALRDVFIAEGNEVLTAETFDEALKLIHQDEEGSNSRRIALFISERVSGFNALLWYAKNNVPQRVMAYLIAENPSRRLKDDSHRAGAYFVFERESRQATFDSMVSSANNAPGWMHLKAGSEDHLTGLDNPRGFYHAVVPQLITMRDKRKRNYHSVASLLVADADRFKSINDTFGHVSGSEAIKAIARTIHEHVGSSDIVCRYGGDEFLVWIPGLTKLQATPIGRRLQKAVSDIEISSADNRRMQLSISVGIAEIWRFGIGGFESAEACLTDLIGRADYELYRAKKESH